MYVYLLVVPLYVRCLSFFVFFFFNDTATTEIYTLSLHDALPISGRGGLVGAPVNPGLAPGVSSRQAQTREHLEPLLRSEEHTSELQSPCNLVCRLLLEKKKKIRGMILPDLVRRYERHDYHRARTR